MNYVRQVGENGDGVVKSVLPHCDHAFHAWREFGAQGLQKKHEPLLPRFGARAIARSEAPAMGSVAGQRRFSANTFADGAQKKSLRRKGLTRIWPVVWFPHSQCKCFTKTPAQPQPSTHPAPPCLFRGRATGQSRTPATTAPAVHPARLDFIN